MGHGRPCRVRASERLPKANWKGDLVFLFKLTHADDTPADPPTVRVAVPNWRAGDTITVGHRRLRVVAVRDDDADQPPTLVVEDAA